MPKMKITFSQLIQDSQDFGGDDEHMVSRAFFSIDFNEKYYEECTVDLKQIVGSNIETSPIEVSNLQGYKGPMDRTEFQNCVENYFRSNVGSKGSGIHFGGGSGTVRMRHNIFQVTKVVEFEVALDSPSAGW